MEAIQFITNSLNNKQSRFHGLHLTIIRLIVRYLKYQIRPVFSPIRTHIRITDNPQDNFYASLENSLELRQYLITTLQINRYDNSNRNVLILVKHFHTMGVVKSLLLQQDFENVEVQLFSAIISYPLERRYHIIINVVPTKVVEYVRKYMSRLLANGIFYQLIYDDAVSERYMRAITKSMRKLID